LYTKVNDGKGHCFRIGAVEFILNGSLYKVSLVFGKKVAILIGEKNA
jgi:hypothetical protein